MTMARVAAACPLLQADSSGLLDGEACCRWLLHELTLTLRAWSEDEKQSMLSGNEIEQQEQQFESLELGSLIFNLKCIVITKS